MGTQLMAIADEPDVTSTSSRYCAHCGHPATEGSFCRECGNPVETPTAAPPPRPPTDFSKSAPPLPPPSSSPRPHIVLIAAGGALGLVAVAVAVIILLSSSGSDAGHAYSQRLTTALAPLVAANNALSSSLQSLHGTDTRAATSAASQAQQAVVAARGAVAVLTVPTGSVQLSQQAQQALAQEGGYVQAVSATLSRPSSDNISQLQPLVTGAQSALVPLASVAPGASASLTGTAALNSWATSRIAAAARAAAAAARKAQQRAIQLAAGRAQAGPGSSSSGSSSSGSSGSSGSGEDLSVSRDCGNGVTAGPNTTCPFATSVRAAWQAAPGDFNNVDVYSAATNTTITMNCGPSGSGIVCTGGNNASVSW